MKRQELIKRLKKSRIVDDGYKIIVKKLDYSNNPISPVETAYRVHYTSCGERRYSTYFGENLGFQG